MKYIIYETTNVSNGKKYRGAHACESLDDGYLGSGKSPEHKARIAERIAEWHRTRKQRGYGV